MLFFAGFAWIAMGAFVSVHLVLSFKHEFYRDFGYMPTESFMKFTPMWGLVFLCFIVPPIALLSSFMCFPASSVEALKGMWLRLRKERQ